jgi:hypothetical protein
VVSDVLPAGLPPQVSRPLPAAAAEDGSQDKFVAFVSGLQLASSKADYMQVRLFWVRKICIGYHLCVWVSYIPVCTGIWLPQ